MKTWAMGSIALMVLACVSARAWADDAAQLPLVPYPQTVQVSGGALRLPAGARIVAGDESLSPLARVVADEIVRAGGPALQVAGGDGKAGDIVLKLDSSMKGEAYHAAVGDEATVSGGNYSAVAMGTVTLLQAMKLEDGGAALPHMTVEDAPRYGYRGLMIDVAREHHSIESLEAVVEMCRMYKTRYLQLHLTDDEAFTFPSKAFPEISSKNWSGPAYTLDELKGLVKFADEHGVTIIPELESPGHCGAMQRAMPETFGMIGPDGKPVGINCMNFMNPKAYPALETLVGEMCDVFKSSPYFHIGSDEAWLGDIGPRPETKKYLKEHGLDDPYELYAQYIVKMNDLVKKQGKKTIVWEGFGGVGSKHFTIPRDVTVMEFEVRYNLPQDLIRNGYTVINAAWTPMYVTNGTQQTPKHIYGWDLYRFGAFPAGGWNKVSWTQVSPTPLVPGAQMCTWGQPQWLEIPSLHTRIPATEQRIWNPQEGGSFGEFSRRFTSDDALLDKLIYDFTMDVAKGPELQSENVYVYSKSASVSASPLIPGLTIHYTINGKEPTADSPVMSGPIELTEKKGVSADHRDAPHSLRSTVWARAFRGDSPAGAPRVLFLDNYDYLERLPKAVDLKIYSNPTGSIKQPDFSTLKLLREIKQPHVWPNAVQDLPEGGSVLAYEGKIEVPANGDYECTLRSNDGGSRLYIDGQLVCDRSGQSNWDETKGSIKLSKGPAKFKVECYLGGKGMFFSLTMTNPADKKTVDWTKLLIPFDKQ